MFFVPERVKKAVIENELGFHVVFWPKPGVCTHP